MPALPSGISGRLFRARGGPGARGFGRAAPAGCARLGRRVGLRLVLIFLDVVEEEVLHSGVAQKELLHFERDIQMRRSELVLRHVPRTQSFFAVLQAVVRVVMAVVLRLCFLDGRELLRSVGPKRGRRFDSAFEILELIDLRLPEGLARPRRQRPPAVLRAYGAKSVAQRRRAHFQGVGIRGRG